MTSSILHDFTAEMAKDVGVPPSLITDGRIHRFRGDGDGPGRLNCWYLLRPDGRSGAYGSWRLGVSRLWAVGRGEGASGADADARRRMAAEAARAAEAETAERHRAGAAAAWERWSEATPADPEHPYLKRKAIPPLGLRQYGAALLVPLADPAFKLWSLQLIYPGGAKRFLLGARIAGCASPIGDTADDDVSIVICEGFATGATIYVATGLPILAAMNTGNLAPVAKAVRRQRPDRPIILAADDDRGTDGNPGQWYAREAALAVGGRVVSPHFGPGDHGTDFNDVGVTKTRETFIDSGVTGVTGVTGAAKSFSFNDLGCSDAVTPGQKPVLPGVTREAF